MTAAVPKITPDKCVSHREKLAREGVMDAVRKRILAKKLKPADIMSSSRPLYAMDHQRILASDYDCFSLRRAILLADSAGVDDISFFRSIMPHIAE